MDLTVKSVLEQLLCELACTCTNIGYRRRLVCMVFVDGKDAGLKLLKQGLAWAYEHYLPEATLDIQESYRFRIA